MLELALLIGAYSYTVFLLGILGVLFKQAVVYCAFFYIFIGICIFLKKKNKKINLSALTPFSKFLLLIIMLQILVNFIGVLGPEISFDALWYHLTLPKIFLENHKIFHIGGVLYYSDIPKNIEMLYIFALSIGNEITAKFIHFLFGIGTIFALYRLSRRFLNQNLALLSVVTFYSSLLIGWESITAYVDLGTAFFTILAVNEFLTWTQNKNNKNLFYTAILSGLAVSTKVTSLAILPIFSLLIFLVSKNKRSSFKEIIKYNFIAIILSSPWFLFSFLNTGNPFFPIFSKGFSFAYDLSPLSFIKQILVPQDPINPIFLIIFPLFFVFYKKLIPGLKYIFVFLILNLLFWIFLYPVGGVRLMLPFIFAFSVLSVYVLSLIKSSLLKKFVLCLIIIVAVSSIFYRFIANLKYIPVVLGNESKSRFLSDNLNYSYGDFYDTDNFLKNKIGPKDKALTIGFHNLYYVDFPFVDESFVKKGDKFNYIVIQNSNLPKRFSDSRELYYNPKTGVRVYTNGGKIWVY